MTGLRFEESCLSDDEKRAVLRDRFGLSGVFGCGAYFTGYGNYFY